MKKKHLFWSIGTLVLLSFTCIEYLIPDDYPVTDEMLSEFQRNNNTEGIFESDKAWFKNSGVNEVLIFELYTDYHRMAIYHCETEFLFDVLIKDVIVHRKSNQINDGSAGMSQEKQVYKNYLENAQQIDKSYFTTKQGLKLGMNKNEILIKYNKPDTIISLGDIEKAEFHYKGEYHIRETGETPKGKIAKDSFGYHMVMYFKNSVLVGLVIKNDVP
jgi:hypothetical protein